MEINMNHSGTDNWSKVQRLTKTIIEECELKPTVEDTNELFKQILCRLNLRGLMNQCRDMAKEDARYLGFDFEVVFFQRIKMRLEDKCSDGARQRRIINIKEINLDNYKTLTAVILKDSMTIYLPGREFRRLSVLRR